MKPQFGKYRILAELGRGGMADVFLAMLAGPAGSGFSKLSVVKRLRPNLAEDPDFVAMLMDEARISARLNHMNVVQTHEVGVEGDAYYLAMEYLDGQPLHRIQRRSALAGKRLDADLELLVLSDVLAGLHHAHELTDYDGTPLNIVHRDVTPSNVFVTYGGHVKVVDFGIAKAAGRACETRQGVVKGKIRYMAPEQAMGLAIDRRADVFAVGILMWEALIGKRFWSAQDDIGIARKLIAGEYDASPRAVDPSIPEELDRIVVKAMAHAAHDRYETAEALRLALDGYLTQLDTITLRKQLGGRIAELFTKERAQLKDIIDRAGRETVPVSVEALAASRSMSTSGPSVSQPPPSGSMRPTVIDTPEAAPPPRPLMVPPPNGVPAYIPPVVAVAPKTGLGSYVLATGAFLATVGIVFGALTLLGGERSVAVEPMRAKAVAAHVIARHRQAAHIEKQVADVQFDAPQPIVVQQPVVVQRHYSPPSRQHAKATPPPPSSSVAVGAVPDRVDTKPPSGELAVPEHRKKNVTTLDTSDPWKGLPRNHSVSIDNSDPW